MGLELTCMFLSVCKMCVYEREGERESSYVYFCSSVFLCLFCCCLFFFFWLWAIIMQMATEWIIIWRFAEFVFCPRHWILAGVWSLSFLWDWILACVWSLSFLWNWILAAVGQTCHGYCGMVVSFAEFMSASLRSVHWFCCTWKRYHYQHIGSTALERGTSVSSLVILDLKMVLLSVQWLYCTSKKYHCQCIVVLHLERYHCQCIGSTALQRGSTVSALVLLHLEEILLSVSHSEMKKAYDWTEVHQTECCMLQWQNWCICFSDAQKYLLYADSVYIY